MEGEEVEKKCTLLSETRYLGLNVCFMASSTALRSLCQSFPPKKRAKEATHLPIASSRSAPLPFPTNLPWLRFVPSSAAVSCKPISTSHPSLS
jgi:hypothetical protein